jgi:hypothetical protein
MTDKEGMSTRQAVYDAETVRDLTEHIGWTEIILPRLIKAKENWQHAVNNALLGYKLVANGTELLPHQLAARVYGIEFIIGEIEAVLKKGESAAVRLEEESRKFRME